VSEYGSGEDLSEYTADYFASQRGYSGRTLCPKCKEGCYWFDDDQTPGYRSYDATPCCKCGAKE